MISRKKFRTEESIEANKLLADPEARKGIITAYEYYNNVYHLILSHEDHKIISEETLKYKGDEFITNNKWHDYRNTIKTLDLLRKEQPIFDANQEIILQNTIGLVKGKRSHSKMFQNLIGTLTGDSLPVPLPLNAQQQQQNNDQGSHSGILFNKIKIGPIFSESFRLDGIPKICPQHSSQNASHITEKRSAVVFCK